MNNYNFLQDKRFLQQVNKLRIKQQFVKITVLNWNQEPIKQIQGVAISGSVNLDGTSSMRRTATLSLFTEEKNNNLQDIDSLFAVNKKCFLELGITNTVPEYHYQTKDQYKNIINHNINYQNQYGKIVWFPLGLYVMFNPSISHSISGVTISMQLKDKMCLLNGDLGGQIHSAIEFSNQDQIYDENSAVSMEKQPVLIYNIIKELVNHWGNEQLSKIIISEVPLQIKQVVKWMGNGNIYLKKTGTAPNQYYTLTTTKPSENIKKPYYIEPGDDIGFIYTDFVYPGELTCNAGDTVTSVLDKIIGIMGNYQYFYDVFGNFIFQQKANYLNMTNVAYWTKEGDPGDMPVDQYQIETRLTKSTYNFEHNKITSAYNNSLNYNNLKNDFVVWGYRNTTNSNIKIPCRFHLAIDKKPKTGITHNRIALFKDDFQVIRGIHYSADNPVKKDDKILWLGVQYTVIYAGDKTSKDWRQQIYYQMLQDQLLGTGQNTELNNTYSQYYAQLKQEFPKMFDLEKQEYKTNIEDYPNEIDYYLDFIDENSQLGQYSVSNIGRRAKIIDGNNEGINCVFEPVIPDIVYLCKDMYNKYKDPNAEMIKIRNYLIGLGYEVTQIQPEIYNLFEIGGNLNSCFEKIKDLLYQYTHVNNTISITTLPIYFLQPNTRITVNDEPAGIYGDYIIQSISLPLDINSMMSINAYKALQKI